MNLSFRIARRYLFAKKSTNAINIITGISVFGLTVGTAALILVLSVFNGFEDLITGLFSNFNPDVKVLPAVGKTFEVDSTQIAQLKALEGVEAVAQTMEEVAFFEYKDNQDFGTIKGVDEYYGAVTSIDSTIREGVYDFQEKGQFAAVLGVGMRNKLGVDIGDKFTALAVYMPKRKATSALQKQFTKKFAYPVGTFVIQQDFDNQYVLTSLDFVRQLLGYDNELSSLELKLSPNFDKEVILENIRNIMGEAFIVKDRYQQDEAFLKLMNIEKWMSFAILSLTLLLVAFNLIGSLWMIVLEKRKDIAILKSMGTQDISIRNIFLYQGVLLCLLGLVAGCVVAILLYVSQKSYGIVPIPTGFVVDAYPISMRFVDFMVVAVTVVSIGVLASIPPALRAVRVSAMIREE